MILRLQMIMLAATLGFRIGDGVVIATQIIHQPTDQASLWIRPDGTILLACSTFEDWFGYGAKELQSMTIYNLVMDRAAQLRE
jgi:hypothetical protein